MSTERYRVGEFTLDLSLGSLRRGDAEVPLRPKSFALLHYLITHAGRLVRKDELLSEIWPKVLVTDDSLTRCISEVRAALEDTEQKIIKTVPKRGYVFAGPVIRLDDYARVGRPVLGGSSGNNVVGRGRRTLSLLSLIAMSAIGKRRSRLRRPIWVQSGITGAGRQANP